MLPPSLVCFFSALSWLRLSLVVLLLHRLPEPMLGAWLCQFHAENPTPVSVRNSHTLAELCTHWGHCIFPCMMESLVE